MVLSNVGMAVKISRRVAISLAIPKSDHGPSNWFTIHVARHSIVSQVFGLGLSGLFSNPPHKLGIISP
jgi:hypothetical protein